MTEIGFKLPVVGVWSLCIRRLKKKKQQMYVTITFLSLKLLENNLTLI